MSDSEPTPSARTVQDIGEFGLIERLHRLLPSSPQVIEGIGDDCAVLRIFDRLIVMSCDQSIENVHFRRDWAKPEDIGWKAAASSLSDIAAMGCMPMFSVVSFACPGDTEVAVAESLFHGISSIMSLYGVSVVGGDTCRSPHIALDVTVLGSVRGNRYLRRSGAQLGDLLVVTNTLGVAAAGCHALIHGHSAPKLVEQHFRPSPRIQEGHWLAGCADVHAAIDISDGLYADAAHMVEANGLGVNLRREALPVSDELAHYCNERQLDPAQFVLQGGEDYELAFALSANEAQRTIEAFHHEFRTPLHVVGEFTDEWHGVRLDGEEVKLSGFDHFRMPNDESNQA